LQRIQQLLRLHRVIIQSIIDRTHRDACEQTDFSSVEDGAQSDGSEQEVAMDEHKEEEEDNEL
jgi:hypothetical protein